MEFKKSNRYYFDVDKEIIYGIKKFTKGYYHELQHYNDNKMKWYRKLNNFFDIYVQIFCFLFVIGMFIFLFDRIIYIKITLFFIPYAIFRVQEEGRAIYYAYKMTK